MVTFLMGIVRGNGWLGKKDSTVKLITLAPSLYRQSEFRPLPLFLSTWAGDAKRPEGRTKGPEANHRVGDPGLSGVLCCVLPNGTEGMG